MAADFKKSTEDYAYRTYIKDIYLELPDYKHIHSSLHGNGDEVFVGRGENSKKIEDTLNSSEKNGNGSYLVTGYRGMGKTSLVNGVIKNYGKKKLNEGILIRRINVNFSQTNLDETGILKQMVQNIVHDIERNPFIRFSTIATLKNIYLVVTYLLLLFLFIDQKGLDKILKLDITNFTWTSAIAALIGITIASFSIVFFKRLTFWVVRMLISIISMSGNYYLYVKSLSKIHFLRDLNYLHLSIPITFFLQMECMRSFHLKLSYNPLDGFLIHFNILFLVLVQLLLFIKIFNVLKYFYEMVIMEKKVYDKLTELLERCNASITSEVGVQNAGDTFLLGFIDKRTKTYPIANSKEIENEIILVLKEYNKFRLYKKKYIVVFDELDKIEAHNNLNVSNYEDKPNQNGSETTQKEIIELSMRKKIILNILSSLKYFTTEAKARFIFIAGREMFDASLADIADRQSSISSIFHQIIYLDSFLKDKGSLGLARGLTNLVEEYLQRILLPGDFYDPKLSPDLGLKLKTSSSFIKKYYYYLEARQANTTDQNLKIIYTIQNFIIYLTYRSNGSPKKLVKLVEEYIEGIDPKRPDDDKEKYKSLYVRRENPTDLYIRFSYKSQYKFAFIAYLYRPFILNYSQFIKQYSDNVLVSTPFLMDHIIKFHPFAFSVQNLELLPEVISNNKNPILRYFIEELIAFLGENHIRETDIGLFEYKFINKTADEIFYLSKIFEAESAAFNFTLNETDMVKNYIQGKIREAVRNSGDVNGKSDNRNYPLTFLYNLLGDAYYFDQEFDNAIISYQSGLALLSPPFGSFVDYEGFVIWIRFKLKLGLVYEKMKSYEMALGIYNDSISDTLTYFKTVSNALKPNSKWSADQDRELFGALNNLLQMIVQPLLSSMYLVEKHSLNGIGIADLERYHQTYHHIVKYSQEQSQQLLRVTANYYNNVGNLLYYKNFKSDTSDKKDEVNTSPASVGEVYTSKIKSLIYQDFNDYISKASDQSSPWKYPPREPQLVRETNEVEHWTDANGEVVEKFNKDYRFSFHAFVAYKNAFGCLVNSMPGVHCAGNTLTEMFYRCAVVNFDFQNRYDKTNLKGIASSISNIANQLFSILNTKTVKSKASMVLRDAAKTWHGRLAGVLEGYKEVKEAHSKLVSESLTDIETTKAYGDMKQALQKINKNWYTHDQISQDVIYLCKWPHNPSEPDIKKYLNDVEKLLSSLTEKMIKDRFKHGILAFWDKYIFEYFRGQHQAENKNDLSDLDLIILLYYLSGRFYSRAGKSFSFGFQLKKILHVIKNAVEISPVANDQTNVEQSDFLSLIEETFLFQVLEITSWVSNSTDRPQIYKYKDSQGIETIYHRRDFARYNYFNTSNASAIKEAIYMFADIKLNSIDFGSYNSVEACAKAIPEFSLTSPYNIVSTQYSRILELDLQEKMNRAMLKSFLFKKIFPDAIRKIFDNKGEPGALALWEGILFNPYKRYGVRVLKPSTKANQDIYYRYKLETDEDDPLGGDKKPAQTEVEMTLEDDIEFALWKMVDAIMDEKSGYREHFEDYQKLVANSLYSLRQIIASIRIQGPNYYISYSYLAFFHLKLGTWYKHYALCRSILRRLKQYYKEEKFNKIDRYIQDLLGSDGIITLDSTSQYQIALQYYHKAKQMHSNGVEYERSLKNLIYLEDDFNDNLYHFGIALERQRLNSYHIRRKIKRLENELKDSPLYRYDSFVQEDKKKAKGTV
jgi:Cdc6-like AAA superfamily ATPase